MSELPSAKALAARPPSQNNRTVESILRMRFPMETAFEPAGKVIAAQTGVPHAALQRLDAERRRLMALAPSELVRERAEEWTRYEASQFFNHRDAIADFDHWAQMDHWTLEESVALLLGRNPEIVTWKKLKGLTTLGFPFIERYDKLLKIAQRAEALTASERLKPAQVVDWATSSQVIEPPAELIQRLRARGRISAPAPDSAPTVHKAEPTDAQASNKKWTPEKRAELSAYRAKHGTEAAALHFNISTARVRQLLPTTPAPRLVNSAFNYRPK